MNFYFKILYLKSLLISWNICLHSVEAKFSQRFTIQVQDGFSTAQNIANKHRKIIHFRSTFGRFSVWISVTVENYLTEWCWSGHHIQIYLFYLFQNRDRDAQQQRNRELQF